jgi:putative transcriptional regulator
MGPSPDRESFQPGVCSFFLSSTVIVMPDCLRGRFLVSARGLTDPNFFKTVVLIVEHNDHGTMGLVVNRPSSVSVHNALSQYFEIPSTEEVVYVGGPVEPSALFILHDAEEMECECPIVPGLFCGSSEDVFEDVVRAYAHKTDDQQSSSFRIFSGCAGWAPHQAEGEIARGDWHIMPASADLVLHDDSYELWDKCNRKIQIANRILPHTVRNPEWN